MTDTERRRINGAMIRLAAGDRGAFDVVFDGLWPHVLAFVGRAMPGHADREDVAQHTLLKMFSRISDFDTRRDGVSWVFGIATYEVKTLRRQVQRRRETNDTDSLKDVPVSANSAEDLVIRADLRAALAEVVSYLSETDRDSLLRADDAMPATGVTGAARRKRRQRALDRLRALWRKRHA
jgi:DNA-directed RNA polymerase specialized sigma24 family protein